MKKEYITPAVSIIKLDNSLLNLPISGGDADQSGEVESKKNAISFYDDDDDIAAGW